MFCFPLKALGKRKNKIFIVCDKAPIVSEALGFSLLRLCVNPYLCLQPIFSLSTSQSINQFSGPAYPWGVAGAAAQVGASKHLDPLQQRIDVLLGCQGETN